MLDALPVGASGKLVRKPQIVDVDSLGPQHEGYHIVITRLDGDTSIHGKLNAIYPRGSSQYGKMLIVDGRAHEVKPYEVATLTD